MCLDCGCGLPAEVTIEGRKSAADRHAEHPHGPHGHPHDDLNDHRHPYGYDERSHHHEHHVQPHGAHGHGTHGHPSPIGLGESRDEAAAKLLAWNDRFASHNREHFRQRAIHAVNLISAPGSGKTALLEQIARRWAGRLPLAVIEGDPETDEDAARIRRAGAPAIQINTGSACHLDADMIHRALHDFPLHDGSLLFIESVGNMVCPVWFDLGQDLVLAVIATTEGEDKPAKYRDLITAADALLINKIDLLPHLDYDLGKTLGHARAIKADLPIFQVSARSGAGIEDFMAWLLEKVGLKAAGVITPESA